MWSLGAFVAQAFLISSLFACGTNEVDPSDDAVPGMEPGDDAEDSSGEDGSSDGADDDDSAGDGDAGGDDPGDAGDSEDGDGGDGDTKKTIGAQCAEDTECESAQCEGGSCLGAKAGCELGDVQRTPGGVGWMDSYSVDGRCFCDTTFDHNIAEIEVETPDGPRTVKEVCDALGPGPGRENNPIFNDIQCGNGPANDAGDEDWCPGRVDQGEAGCCTIGPKWNFDEE